MDGLSGWEKGVVVLGRGYVVCDGKEPVEIWGGAYGDATIMELLTMERYAVLFLIGVYVVAVISIIGGD